MNNNSVLIVNFDELHRLPPVINLIDVLIRNNIPTKVITFDSANIHKRYLFGVKFYILEKNNNLAVDFITRKKRLRKLIQKLMGEKTIIWTTTDRTVREVGSMLFQYKHVMQLMELVEDYPLFPGQNILKTHLSRYAKKAHKVVVPEYNRAHILQTWWQLSDTPTILPNKPASITFDSNIPSVAKEFIEKKREGKKIVLYQGIIRKERPLLQFAEAIETLKNEYCFCVMGEDKDDEIKKMKENYSCVIHIPFITPPNHLSVTAASDIGILVYVPDANNKHSSLLNALYCAPNKIYEYAGAGLPMLGNDIPGLKGPFEQFGIGEICNLKSASDIRDKIVQISENRLWYKERCEKFYKDTNLDEIVNTIIS